MIRRPPRSTLTEPLFPYPPLFRSSLLTCCRSRKQNPVDTPIRSGFRSRHTGPTWRFRHDEYHPASGRGDRRHVGSAGDGADDMRSEEHTSELQSLLRISYAVLRLKKKNKHLVCTILISTK